MLFKVVSDNIIIHISIFCLIYEAWDEIKIMFIGSNMGRKFSLLTNLFYTQMLNMDQTCFVIYLIYMREIRIKLLVYGCEWVNENLL